MKAGDLVKVHWGNCDWSGEEDVDWGYASGVVAGEIKWWKENGHPQAERISPCGDIDVFVHGGTTSYNIGRLEVINGG